MSRNRFKQRSGGAARLGLEMLEDRSLLAIAAFEVNLYEDVGGAPGELIANDTAEVGETFFVEIMAREFDPLLAGLRSVALDISWDPNVVQEIDSPFDPSALITPYLPVFQSGTLDNEAGTIENLAGGAFLSAGSGRPIGNLHPERFALLHFQAVSSAEGSQFTLESGLSGITTVPNATLSGPQLRFETQTITVVSAPGGGLSKDPGGQANDGTASLSNFQVNVYQGTGGAPPTLVPSDAVDGERGFFVEIILEPPTEASQSVGETGLDPTVSDETDEANSPTEAPARLDVASLEPFADGAIDFTAGNLLVTQVVVSVQNITVDLPLVAGPADEAVFAAHQTRRIALSFTPSTQQAAAADAVFAADASEEPAPAVSVDADHALLQALASGLAAALGEDEVSDPFSAHPI